MILQALCSYYDRLAGDPDSTVSRPGYAVGKIGFALRLDGDGRLVGVEDLRRSEGKRRIFRDLHVPQSKDTRTSGVKAQFLWDKTAYILGADDDAERKDAERVAQCFTSCKELHRKALTGENDPGAVAVFRFFETWSPAMARETIGQYVSWEEIDGANLVFILDGFPGFIHERVALRTIWSRLDRTDDQAERRQCLVTGREAALARLHPSIKGVVDAQTSGAYVVSFNKTAFCSYGFDDDQGLNAPVSEEATFAYATALNALLARGSRQRIDIGDTTYVFWADRPSDAENLLTMLFDPPSEPDRAKDGKPTKDERQVDPATAAKVRAALKALAQGRPLRSALDAIDPEVRFHILGLAAPAKARLSLRLWEVCSLGDLLDRVERHYRDLRLEPNSPYAPEFPPLRMLLRATTIDDKADSVQPALAAGLARAAFAGGAYPTALLATVLERLRRAGDDRPLDTYFRMALIKAYLARSQAISPSSNKEVTMSLDPNNPNPGYRLGRLFAVLEKAQQDAIDANATIKDRYFGSASSAPKAVFPHLLRLVQHHLAKVDKGDKPGFARRNDKLIEDIVQGVGEFPAYLSLDDQGRFALGYYHQRNDLWKKKEA